MIRPLIASLTIHGVAGYALLVGLPAFPSIDLSPDQVDIDTDWVAPEDDLAPPCTPPRCLCTLICTRAPPASLAGLIAALHERKDILTATFMEL